MVLISYLNSDENPEKTSVIMPVLEISLVEFRESKSDWPEALTAEPTAETVSQRQFSYLAYPELEQIRQLEDEAVLSTDVLRQIQSMLISDDPVVRLAALESVRSSNAPDVTDLLIQALADSETIIRLVAIEELGQRQHENLSMHLEPLLFDTNLTVKKAAINALAELESESSAPVLASLLFDDDPTIRNSVVSALDEFDGEQLLEFTDSLRLDSDERLRAQLRWILLERGIELVD